MSEQNLKIEPGKYFEIVYSLFRVNSDGSETLVHEVDADEPDCAILGITPGFVPALETRITGLKKGDTFDFYAEPQDAFGPYEPEEIMTLPRDRFLIDGKFDEEMFAPGSLIPLMTSDGYRIDGVVVELTPTDVRLDFNHPLAKDRVHYKGSVELVREPTEEELHPAHGCGCGCHHEGEGCGEGCGCHHDNGGDACGCGCDGKC